MFTFAAIASVPSGYASSDFDKIHRTVRALNSGKLPEERG